MKEKNNKKKQRYDVIVFDIDNVLVDTRPSYTDCIRETVQTYLEKILGFKPSKKCLLTREDVEEFKWLGGFNDDWDACYGLLLYFLGLPAKNRGIAELQKNKNLKAFRKNSPEPLYVRGIEKRCGKNPAVSLRRVAGIFQKLYWTKYIKKESPILPKKLFSLLSGRGARIGIATGRNRREAAVALKKVGIKNQIAKMITIDDLPNPKLKKPDPYSLIKIAKALGKKLRYLYIGDLPDDIRTAQNAARQIKIDAWGFSFATVSRQKASAALKKAGAKKVLTTPGQLFQALQKQGTGIF